MPAERRRRRDFSWPLGWAAVVIVTAAGVALCIAWNAGNFATQDRYMVTAAVVWLLGALTVAVAVLVALIASPKGRGWRPALGALAIMAVLLILALHAPQRYSNQ